MPSPARPPPRGPAPARPSPGTAQTAPGELRRLIRGHVAPRRRLLRPVGAAAARPRLFRYRSYPYHSPGNEETNSTKDVNSTTSIPGSRLPDNSSSPNATASSTQTTATSTGGVSSSTTHVTSTSQPNTTTPTTVVLTSQPTKTSQTVTSTTASPVTSSQGNITVVTTSKTSSTSVTATSKSEAVIVKTSRFDVGSFVGGIVLTLGVLVVLYIGCKTYHSRRGIQYRTIDEHDAII